MTSMELVLRKHPDAHVVKTKGKVDIRRPRTEGDPPALVSYVLMSGYHLSTLLAWDEAAERLGLI